MATVREVRNWLAGAAKCRAHPDLMAVWRLDEPGEMRVVMRKPGTEGDFQCFVVTVREEAIGD